MAMLTGLKKWIESVLKKMFKVCDRDSDCKEKLDIHPEEKANFLSNCFFIWSLPIFRKGFKKDLGEDDLYPVNFSQSSKELGKKLENAWNKSNKQNFMWTLWDVFKFEVLFNVGTMLLFTLLLRILQPLLLLQILNQYAQNYSFLVEKKIYIFASILVTTIYLHGIVMHVYVLKMKNLGIKLRAACCALLYQKSLKLSLQAKSDTSAGQIITLITNDLKWVEKMACKVGNIFVTPIEILLTFILLYVTLGATAVFGFIFLTALTLFQIILGILCGNYQLKIVTQTDLRLLLMKEILYGIHQIKRLAWEVPFYKKVALARKLELNKIRISSYIEAVMRSSKIFASRVAIFLSILSFVLEGNMPIAKYVFVLTSCFDTLTFSMCDLLPETIRDCVEVQVSCQRMSEYLALKEVDNQTQSNKSDNIRTDITIQKTIILENVSVNWDAKKVLNNINLEVENEEKIAIFGGSGSGKTTLLHLILNEVKSVEGQCFVNGKLSYASQQPWMFRGTIRDNILFGQKLDMEKYNTVLDTCALQEDINTFPLLDQTFIGETGSLSGGQKSRISLARALYKNADIYLLDDPFSALDAQIGNTICNRLFENYLSKKSVILVTHQLEYLRKMDRIYRLENGEIIFEPRTSSIFNITESVPENEPETFRKTAFLTEDVGEDCDYFNEKEQVNTKGISKEVYIRYVCSGGSWPYYVMVFILFITAQLIAGFTDYFLDIWVNIVHIENANNKENQFKNSTEICDSVENENWIPTFCTNFLYQFLSTQNNSIYTYIGLIFLLVFFALIRSVYFYHYCINCSKYLHDIMLRTILKAPIRFFSTNPSGRILNRFSSDLSVSDEDLLSETMETIEIILQSVTVSIILCFVDFWLTIPTLVLFGLFYGFQRIFIKTSRGLKRLESTTRSPILSQVNTPIYGLTTIRAFGSEQMFIKEFNKYQDCHTACSYLFFGCREAFGLVLDLSSAVFTSVITVLTFTSENFGGNVGLIMTQALNLSMRLQRGVRQLSETENLMTCVERILDYTKLDIEDDNLSEPSKDWPKNGDIIFENVNLKYFPSHPPILQNISFEIKAKEKIGIVGRTGAGKSSLIAAFLRLTAIEGCIKIDGVDTKNISLNVLRRSISVISQEPFLFGDSLRKNLDPFEEFDDDKLWMALEKVGLKHMVNELSLGLNFEILENGANFSIGQKQLLCLARAIVKNTKIIILDEAASNVDPRSNDLIQIAIKNVFHDCTVLTIAHRLNNVMDSDKILVMNQGRIVEFDHPYVLLKKENGFFHGLCLQKGNDGLENFRKVAKKAFLLSTD